MSETDAGSNIWTCYCGYRVESDDEPDRTCERCNRTDRWEEDVLADQFPREEQGGDVVCGHCGASFAAYNGPKTAGWYCPECERKIIPRTQPVRIESGDEPDAETTEQAGLSRGEWT